MARTSVDLFVFGNRTGPRRPRIGIDLHPNDQGIISAGTPPYLEGASSFADPHQSGLSGHYHRLPAGSELPSGVDFIADGCDVSEDSEMPATHHTIYSTEELPYDEFIARFMNLPWEYAGRI